MDGLHDRLAEFLSNGDLPGEEAHAKLAPYRRTLTAEFLNNPTINPKESAVLILIYPDENSWRNVLIRRPLYDGTHSGQVAFPGGRCEEHDQDHMATALRETHEEIGIHPNQVEVLGKISDVYIPPSNFLVHPYMGYTERKPDFIPEPKEVAEVIEHNILDLLNDDLIKETDIRLSNDALIKAPYFDIQGHVVWGATAIMLSEVREILQKVV